MRRILILFFLLSLTCLTAFAKGSHGSSSHSGKSRSSKPAKPKKVKAGNAQKTVHVSGYTRKDGTYVAPYDRRPPGTADLASSTPGSRTDHPYRRNYLADGFTPHATVQRDKHGKIKRSSAAKGAFQRGHPCPSNGKTSGGCRGYVVDHVTPLECGGADAPSNMQWQTSTDARIKDKTERNCRI